MFLADTNPFQLPTPPAWWIAEVAAFDPDLVILPSRRKAAYVYARRKKYSAGLTDKAIAPGIQPERNDTAMCLTHGLVFAGYFVCTGAFTSGNLFFFVRSLHERDSWAHGGPLTVDQQKAALFEGGTPLTKAVDAADEAERQRTQVEIRSDLHHASGDAWRSLQVRKKARTLNAGRPDLSR